MDLIDTLLEIADRPIEKPTVYLMRNTLYFSGLPTRWTQFGERAYLFPSAALAQQVMHEFPDEFAGATVHPHRE